LGVEEAPVLRIFVRRSADLSYLEDDLAMEIDGPREGPARWAPLGVRGGVDVAGALTSRRGVAVGYDLVFAAPRTASALVAVGGDRERAGVVTAHRAAVADALGYLERRALVVRRRVLGDEELLGGAWEGAIGFTHGVNRSGEPHLHDHVVVPARMAGRPSAIDGRSLFAHALSADALYRSALRDGVARHAGRDAWRSPRGVEHVGGVDEGVRSIWPGRAERGDKRHWTRAEAVSAWSRDLDGYEPGPEAPAPRPRGPLLDEHAFAGAFEGLSPIWRRDLVRAWADAATRGAPVGTVDESIDRHYPQLARSRGLDGATISRNDARQLGPVREHGARSLVATHHRDAPDRSLERGARSRDW
jgi:hypothetical protein